MSAFGFEDLFLSAGIFGLLGSTILFPILAGIVFGVGRLLSGPSRGRVRQEIRSIDILVMAHNEERQIASTLSSVRTAIEYVKAEWGNAVRVRLIVGADSCNDRTVEISRRFADEIVEFPDHHSKWKTLKALIAQSEADWIGLVDSGSLWAPGFLSKFLELVTEPEIYAFAPGYRVAGSRKSVAQSVWGIERFIKAIENISGGPVSVHGATVLYRREPICEVLNFLEDRNWYNDDVVLPLVLRARFSEARILYSTHPDVIVEDLGGRIEPVGDDSHRRVRLVKGNVQWINSLMGEALIDNPQAGLLSFRRLFRLFWGWWALFLFLAVFLVVQTTSKIGAGVLLFLAALIFLRLKSLRAAFLVSLLSPLMLLNDRSDMTRWK